MSHAPVFHGSWIGSTSVGSPFWGVPAPYVRKSFVLDRPIQKAFLSVTALGLYECEINGRKVGDMTLSPGWTNYHKRVYFQTHDVTDLLQIGDNAIGAILGDGWYCGFVALQPRQSYGDRPQFLAQLEVTMAEGEVFIVVTDESWKTVASPVLQNDLLAGETYDARLEKSGWSAAGFADGDWQSVEVFQHPKLMVEKSPAPPVRRIGEIQPVATIEKSASSSGGLAIIDFGQNFSGRVRLTVRGSRGQTIKLRFAEVLNPDGTLYTENLRAARVTDYYTCKSSEEEVWEPRFTFHGFRYVEISGIKKGQSFQILGVVLHSDMPVTGRFRCSHPLLNQLQQNIVWGQKSNFLDVPTDCPQRDERLGWTGDAQVFIRTACFNMNVRGFFHKWMQDLRDAQRPNGAVPAIAPDCDSVQNIEEGGPAWADATIICPWTIYLCYGDVQILADHYDSMKRFLEFVTLNRCKNNIRSHPDLNKFGGFGDWLALDGSGNEGGTARDLIGTAFYAYDTEIMSRIATVLGREEDVQHFTHLHGRIVEAFRRRFVTPDGLLAGGTQTTYVLALHFGLIPEAARASAAKELVRDIERRGFHLATGFVGTPYLLEVLGKNGYLDIAYKLLEQETFPSWLFPIKNGATTIWERWDGWTPEKGFQDKDMNSFNHYAYGAVGAWMYGVVAGLDLDPEQPGYQHIRFQPRPGGSITWAEASLQTARGEASIRWEINEGVFRSSVKVPVGTTATYYPPLESESPVVLKAGFHDLSWPLVAG